MDNFVRVGGTVATLCLLSSNLAYSLEYGNISSIFMIAGVVYAVELLLGLAVVGVCPKKS